MSTSRKILYAAIAGMSFGCCMGTAMGTPIEQSPAANATLLERCLSAKATEDSFSGVISVTHHGQPVAFVSRGVLADSGTGPIAATTRFNLGSTSKMFTAVAIGQLVDAGKIRWDDPVGKYVSGLTSEASVVTVHQLLTHSSGLGDFFEPQNMEAMLKARTASDILPLIAADKPSFPPGSKFRYSNSGYALLGILIERVSGQHYGDYLREHVFLPAAMINTGLSPEPLATLAVGMTGLRGAPPSVEPPSQIAGVVHPKAADAGHAAIDQSGQRMLVPSDKSAASPGQLLLIGPDGKRMQMKPEPSAAAVLQPAPGATQGYGSPAGGLFSTAADMQHFADALLANKLLSAATRTSLTSPQIVAVPAAEGKPERTYGMGFSVGVEAGRKWFGHGGGTAGANVEFAVFPETQWTLAVFSNRDPPVATIMLRYLKDLLFKPDALQACTTATSH